MAVITQISRERRGRRRERVVYLDGAESFALTEETFLKFSITAGQTLDDAIIKEMVTTDGVARAKEDALRLLNYRFRTRKELEQRLTRKGWDTGVIDRVMEMLERAGLIDDARFARLWVEDRLRLKPAGVSLLRRELRKKGVSPELIETVLQDHENPEDEYTRAYDLLQRRAARYVGLDPQVARRRMLGFLSRRGFTGETMFAVVKRILDEAEE